MARSVDVEQPFVERDVAEELGVLGQVELRQPGRQRCLERSFSTNEKTVAWITRSQEAEDVRQEERVLLSLEAADTQNADLAVVRTGKCLFGIQDVSAGYERNGQLESAGGRAVTATELIADDDDWVAAGEGTTRRLQEVSCNVNRSAPGVTTACVLREVLSDTEEQTTPAHACEQCQGDREGSRPQDPDRVHVRERPPEDS